jgi:hypothetical protein
MGQQGGRIQLQKWQVARFRTMGEAAAYLGIGPSLFGKFVAGSRIPELNLAFKIQKLTGIPAEAWADPKKRRRPRGVGAARHRAQVQAGRDEGPVASVSGGSDEKEPADSAA